VKRIVLPAVVYILLFALSLLLFTTSVFIYRMVVDYSPVFFSLSRLLTELPQTLMKVLPTATAAALIFVLLLRVHSRGRNLLASSLVIVVATALYAFPFSFLHGLQTDQTESFDFPFFEQKLTQIENSIVYIDETDPQETEGISLDGVSLLYMNGDFPKMNYYRWGTADPKGGILYLGEAHEAIMEYGSHRSVSDEFVAAPEFLEDMFGQINELTAALEAHLEKGPLPFFLTALSQVLFLVGAWALIRTSRWPLWNALLSLIAFRGLFYLDSLFRSEVVLQGMQMLAIQDYYEYAAPAFFILIFFFFTIWGFFFTRPETDPEAGL
jgi:hypothetical protein